MLLAIRAMVLMLLLAVVFGVFPLMKKRRKKLQGLQYWISHLYS